jgi:Fe2+ transport system protein FeoA
MNATALQIGQKAKIVRLDESPVTRKLFEMGCVPGTPISLEFKAPAGDPLAFNIDGYVLGLRISEARVIEVELNEVGE